jgi:hypothetical protein
VIAIAAIIGVGVSLYQINEVKKSQKRLEDVEFAPHPYIVAPVTQIKVPDRGKLIKAADMQIRNIGRGTCYDLEITVVFTGNCYIKTDMEGNWVSAQNVVTAKPWEPVKAVNGLTLAPNQQVPFPFDQYPILDTPQPQELRGKIQMTCLDENRKPRAFEQEFSILMVKEGKDLTAHYYMPSPVSVENPKPPATEPRHILN